MTEDKNPELHTRPEIAARFSNIHKDITNELQTVLQSKAYSFRSTEHDGDMLYVLMKEENKVLSIVQLFQEKNIEGRSQKEIIDLLVQIVEFQQSRKSILTKVAVVVVILISIGGLFGWLLSFTPFPPFLYGPLLFIAIISIILLGLIKAYAMYMKIDT